MTNDTIAVLWAWYTTTNQGCAGNPLDQQVRSEKSPIRYNKCEGRERAKHDTQNRLMVLPETMQNP
jgi:hypothetical protein